MGDKNAKEWQIGYTTAVSGIRWLETLYTEEEARNKIKMANDASRKSGLRGRIDQTTWHMKKKE